MQRLHHFSFILTSLLMAGVCAASAPADHWRLADPAMQTGACRAALEQVRAQVRRQPTTAMLAARGDEIVFAEGPIARPSNVASIRKSLLAMLYGRPVADGRIALDASLADLGIDDLGGLLPVERQARVRDLLQARSGVYHPAANGGDDAAWAPRRGSQQPGTYFLYNNWDFNAAGDIYESRTGHSIYDAFEQEIAVPIGMQDFRRARHQRGGDLTQSIHATYPFYLSARDMARVGELMLNHGQWNGRQVVASDWTNTITTAVTHSADMHPAKTVRHRVGYGMLWWIPEPPAGSPLAGPLAGAYMAWGFFGQWILVMPARDMVVVHKFDTHAVAGATNPPATLSVEAFLQEAVELADAPCVTAGATARSASTATSP